MPSIHSLRSTYFWMNVIRNSRMFDSCLLPVADLKFSKNRVFAWTDYLRKNIGKRSFSLFWLAIKHKLLFLFFWDYAATCFTNQTQTLIKCLRIIDGDKFWLEFTTHNTHHTFRFFFLLENVVIQNYNGCSKLTLIQKIEKPLSMRVLRG